jgi:hypothetical protein
MAHPAAFPSPGQSAPAEPKRSTSKAVPIVVAAGLAAGVFAGLFFGVGTAKSDSLPTSAAITAPAMPDPPVALTAKLPASNEPTKPAEPVAAPTPAKGDTPPAATGSADVAASGSAAPPRSLGAEEKPDAAGAIGTNTVAASEPPMVPVVATDKKPEVKMVKVTFAIKPPGAEAELTVDGKPIPAEGAEFDITAGPKKIEVAAIAAGFEPYRKTFSITRDDTVALNLNKKRSSSSSSTKRPPSATKKPVKKPGLIDI